ITDTISLDPSGAVTAGTGTATLRPETAGLSIDLGGSDVDGTALGLTDAELDRITAGTLNIGDASSGAIVVSADISRPAATDIHFQSGVSTTVNSGATLAAGGGTVTTLGGVLVDDGTILGDVVVPAGSTLNGSGSVTGDVSGAGTFSPGNSP